MKRGPSREGAVLHDDDLAEPIVDQNLEHGRLLNLDGPSPRSAGFQQDAGERMKQDSESATVSGIDRPGFPETTTGSGRHHGRVPLSTITGSVGRRGRNVHNDVITVQGLINRNIGKITPLAPLASDGKAGPKTIAAIEAYQNRVLGMQRPDGRVDPGGRTIRELGSGGRLAGTTADDSMCVAVPGTTVDEGLGFLESLAAGTVGGGAKMTVQGYTIPRIRQMYKAMIEQFERELVAKKASGMSAKEIARWAVNERTRIARAIRSYQGTSSMIILELRDAHKYGVGGRSYHNMAKRAAQKGVAEADLPAHLLKNAVKPNQAISDGAIKGARFLKHGGRVVVFVSISITAYTLLTAPEDQLERILYEEIGGAALGAAGGGLGVGLCLVFGIATSGWGLLACGVVGGGAGGIIGSELGSQVYSLKEQYVIDSQISRDGGFQIYDPRQFQSRLE